MLNNDDTRIEDWTIRSMAPTVNMRGPFKVYLDIGVVDDSGGRGSSVFMNVTSRLVATTDQGFQNGDKIRCFGTSNDHNLSKNLTLSYNRTIG
jgi:hypothetical protein